MKPVPTRKENYLLSDLCKYPLSTPLFRDVFWLLHVFKINARLFTVKYGHTIIKSVTDCWPVCTELYAKKPIISPFWGCLRVFQTLQRKRVLLWTGTSINLIILPSTGIFVCLFICHFVTFNPQIRRFDMSFLPRRGRPRVTSPVARHGNGMLALPWLCHLASRLNVND